MAHFLHKLGLATYRHPWRTISVWLVILTVLAASAAYFIKPTSSSISIPGTDAQKAIDRADELFSGSGGGTGRIVFQATNGKIADHKDEINELIGEVGKIDGVGQAVSPFVDDSFVSKSGTIAYGQVQLTQELGSIEDSTLDKVAGAVGKARSSDLQIEIAGDLVTKMPGEIIGVGEIVGVLVALMVLLITFGSLVAAGMPLLSALLAIGVSMAGLFSLSQVIDINTTTPVLAIMLGLAVGIDYSLFIINKYRSFIRQGYTFEKAAANAIGTAGNAVVFAAITVVIALAALSVVNIPFMTIMGLVGAGSIAVSAIVAITFTPAVLRLIGPRVFGKKDRLVLQNKPVQASKKQPKINKKMIWYKWGELLTKRPIPVIAASLLVIAMFAWPVVDLKLGLPTDQYAAKDSTQRKAYDLLTEGFGPGFNAPLTVVTEGMPKVGVAEKEAIRRPAMEQLNQAIAKETAKQQVVVQQQMAAATSPEQMARIQQQIVQAQAEGEQQKQAAIAQIEANVEQYANMVQLNNVADSIAKMSGVATVLPAVATADGTAGIIQVIPTTAPADDKTTHLIERLRSESTAAKLTGGNDIAFAVTGSIALQDDINSKLAAALPVYLGVVVGLSFVLLVVAFRSILIPIKATLGFLLSVLAMFGAIVAVFQWGWFGIAEAPGPIVSFVPIIATGILFGLAMDYEFFLVSGMHESYARSKNAQKAIKDGFGIGSKVVTAAAIIMISVFGGFIANHDSTVQSLGFGLAIGILVDAFIVRMTIVPAVMSLLGKAAWWLPKWLNRLLPHVSIEGEVSKK